MIRDLRTILDGWEYEPGKISVRKIIGRDGRTKIQTRIDLGLLQLETTGRPDGQRPYGCASLLEYHERRLDQHIARHGSDAGFELSPDDSQELRHEAYLHYQRYLSLFVLEEFDGVRQDTEQNLRLIDLATRYAARRYDRELFASQRAYVLMMNIRAQAYEAVAHEAYEAALSAVTRGIEEIRQWVTADGADEDSPALPEVEVLLALRREVLEEMPEDAPARIRHELRAAVAREDYERATLLRDQLALSQPREPSDS
jgi:hypothetical protein